MSKIGRNVRCPCGSGKKYKHCCLARVLESRLTTTADHVNEPEQRSAVQHLIAFAGPEFDEDREVAQMLFWGP